MVLKRNYRGIEGYFYKSGNKKLEVQPGLIDKVAYFKFNGQTFLNLHISKCTHISFIFELSDTRDISSLLEDFQVSNIRAFNKLPERERLVLVYNHDGFNYGISLGK